MQLFANWDGPDQPVERFGILSTRNAAAGSAGISVEYTRMKGTVNGFILVFSPFDGTELTNDESVAIASEYTYVDQDNGIREYFTPEGTLADQFAELTTSAVQLKATVIANFEALRSQVAQVATGDALDKANTEIDRRIEFIDVNAEELYALTVEQLSIEECG